MRLKSQFLTGLLLTACIILLDATSMAAERKIRIAYFTSNSKGNTYWPQVFRVMDAVAKSLDFEFVHYDFGAVDRFDLLDQYLKVINSGEKFDAMLFVVVQGNTKPILDAAEKKGIPVFINGPVFPAELTAIGEEPRLKYKQWVGYFYADEKRSGYLTARKLLELAEQNKAYSKNGKIEVVGLGGRTSWFGSTLRRQGLEQAMQEFPNSVLNQVVPTFWTELEGHDLTVKMLKRFPETAIVWGANDLLSIGAAKALVEQGRKLGKKSFAGGIDVSDNGLEHIKSNAIEVTSGASMLNNAEYLIYLYDYLRGVDFAPEIGTVFLTKTYAVTKDEVNVHLKLSEKLETIDFRQFSKYYQARSKRYDFSLEAYLNAAGIPK